MSRRNWWPSGHQLPKDEVPIWTFKNPDLNASLEKAECDANRAEKALETARLNDASPSDLERLSMLATQARIAYYEALNADLAL